MTESGLRDKIRRDPTLTAAWLQAQPSPVGHSTATVDGQSHGWEIPVGYYKPPRILSCDYSKAIISNHSDTKLSIEWRQSPVLHQFGYKGPVLFDMRGQL